MSIWRISPLAKETQDIAVLTYFFLYDSVELTVRHVGYVSAMALASQNKVIL